MTFNWTTRDVGRLKLSWGKGQSQRQLARMLGCSQWLVAAKLRELGLSRQDPRKWTPLQKRRIKKLKERQELPHIRNDVWRARAAQHGWPGAQSDAEVRLLEAVWELGITDAKHLAAILKISRNQVRTEVRRLVSSGLLEEIGKECRCKRIQLKGQSKVRPGVFCGGSHGREDNKGRDAGEESLDLLCDGFGVPRQGNQSGR